ncbi:retrovirus-related pol polyprotein from transposon TNT 1-94 [Tanacetum coccineum]|uniref:Retrovirus-related pol polyprotein from transposon TNT 1-94 n=1 Tax=Tanacetum coccineum TaxID=301880 RepID=A0ABQ5B5W5_9ASTR
MIQALADPSWVEAMQEELLQFKLQKVWTLVDYLMARGQSEPNRSLETRKMREELSLETRKDWLHKVTPKKKALIIVPILAMVLEIEVEVRIYQKSQENRKKRANTDTGNGRAQKKPEIQSQSQKKSTFNDRYAVSNGSGYAVLISLNEYAVLDRKLDTPYLMEVDTPYSAIDQNIHTKPNKTRTPQLSQDTRKTNNRVSFSTRVISTTSVNRSQLKSNRLEDRVLHNNSEGKKQQVEDHRRNFKFSNNKTSITVCNDSLNAKTSNVNFVCVTCGKCVLNDNHDMCVLHYINGVNSRTKMPMAVPISTREPKRTVNQSVATSLKRTVASESTNQKPRSKIRKQYEQISKTCKWWYSKITPPGYKWKPKTSTVNVKPNVSMPLGIKFRTTIILEPTTLRKSTISNTPSSSNSFAARRDNSIHHRLWVLKAHDRKSQVQGNITIKRVYYGKGLNHNLFSVGQFCDADLEVACQNSTCYIRDLKGNDLLTSWLWHRRLSHLNFDTINLLSKYDTVTGLPKLKFFKDYLCSSCEYTWTQFLMSKYETLEVLIDFLKLIQRGLHAQVRTVRTDKGMEFLNKTLHAYIAQEGIEHQTSTVRTPEQNSIVERRNRTLVE